MKVISNHFLKILLNQDNQLNILWVIFICIFKQHKEIEMKRLKKRNIYIYISPLDIFRLPLCPLETLSERALLGKRPFFAHKRHQYVNYCL
jgi:hypothetical protein